MTRARTKRTEAEGADGFIASGRGSDLDGPARETLMPSIAREGEDLRIAWAEHQVECVFAAIQDLRDGVHAELAISHGGVDLHWGRLGLSSTTARRELVTKLDGIVGEVPWRTVLERACRTVAAEVRRAEPPVLLTPRLIAGARYLVEPFLPLGDPTVLFADGGSGKGYLALALAAAAARGVMLPGGFGASRRVPVLYLDWETNQATLEDRLYRLGRGLDVDLAGCVHYRRMIRPLVDELRPIRADVARLAIGLLIADSLGPACGDDPESAGAAIGAMRSLRALDGVSSLVLAHVSKAMADQKGAHRPYGSVFVQNLARAAWEVRAMQDGRTLTVALYDRKENDAARRPEPIPFCFTFEPGRVLLSTRSLADEPDLLAPAPLATRLLIALADGTPKTSATLSGFLDEDEETISRTCRRLAKADKLVRVSGDAGGRGNETLWGKRT